MPTSSESSFLQTEQYSTATNQRKRSALDSGLDLETNPSNKRPENLKALTDGMIHAVKTFARTHDAFAKFEPIFSTAIAYSTEYEELEENEELSFDSSQ